MASVDELRVAYETAVAHESELGKAREEAFRVREHAAGEYFRADALAGGRARAEFGRWGRFSGTPMASVTKQKGVTEADVCWAAWEACWELLGGDDAYYRLHPRIIE